MSTTRSCNGWLLIEERSEAPKFRVLALPGLMGSDVVFSKLMAEPSLAEAAVHIIAGNPPGFKGLPVPHDFDFSIESYAAIVESLAEAENIDLILGHSFAGNVLIEVAGRGRYKRRLMIISPSLEREAETKDLKNLDSMSRKPLIRGLFLWLTYLMMKSAFTSYFDDEELLAAVVADAKKIPRSIARKVLMGYFDHIDKHGNLAERLATTQVPVYYLRGDQDDIKLTDENRARLEAYDRVKVFDIPGARHFAMTDNPAEVAKLIIQMLTL
ncbi:MAG: alpha/beta hydrolase [Candidatus Aminicenantes bacterium]|nr:alpha/beta hydrolase [Candidatus Aminicenantes bacterium]MDH5385571.1 alpha/beta hydrolase [Candidatus Aminicenantes bacterium]